MLPPSENLWFEYLSQVILNDSQAEISHFTDGEFRWNFKKLCDKTTNLKNVGVVEWELWWGPLKLGFALIALSLMAELWNWPLNALASTMVWLLNNNRQQFWKPDIFYSRLFTTPSFLYVTAWFRGWNHARIFKEHNP